MTCIGAMLATMIYADTGVGAQAEQVQRRSHDDHAEYRHESFDA